MVALRMSWRTDMVRCMKAVLVLLVVGLVHHVLPSSGIEDGITSCKLRAVATAVSADYFDSLQNLVGSLHVFEAALPILVFDLGISDTQKAAIQTWENTKLFRFPFENFPPHVRRLSNFAWKACVVKLAVERAGCVLYLDSGMELRHSLDDIRSDLIKHGQWFVAASMGAYHSILTLTHPEQISALGLDQALQDRASLAAGMQGWCVGAESWSSVFLPWLACSLRAECIAPEGSNGTNHRFDQSALSLIVHANNDARAARNQAPLFIQRSLTYWLSRSMLHEEQMERLNSARVSVKGLFLFARRTYLPKPFAPFVRRRADPPP